MDPLLVRRTPGVVEVVFNRPHRHNAFTTETYDGVLALCASLRDDDSVRVVVFRGAGGRAFAAGNEISEFESLTDGSDGVAYEAKVGRVLRGIAELRDYFGRALSAYANLRFSEARVLPGVRSLVVYYRSVKGLMAAETMELDAAGRVVRVLAHYTPAE